VTFHETVLELHIFQLPFAIPKSHHSNNTMSQDKLSIFIGKSKFPIIITPSKELPQETEEKNKEEHQVRAPPSTREEVKMNIEEEYQIPKAPKVKYKNFEEMVNLKIQEALKEAGEQAQPQILNSNRPESLKPRNEPLSYYELNFKLEELVVNLSTKYDLTEEQLKSKLSRVDCNGFIYPSRLYHLLFLTKYTSTNLQLSKLTGINPSTDLLEVQRLFGCRKVPSCFNTQSKLAAKVIHSTFPPMSARRIFDETIALVKDDTYINRLFRGSTEEIRHSSPNRRSSKRSPSYERDYSRKFKGESRSRSRSSSKERRRRRRRRDNSRDRNPSHEERRRKSEKVKTGNRLGELKIEENGNLTLKFEEKTEILQEDLIVLSE